MHVVMFGDQHVESSGGAQVSMRLQRRFLERAGHTVTIVAPRLHARRVVDPAFVDLPSVPITLDREYGLSVPGRRSDRRVDLAMSGRPPVDVVHVQADFWGALIGHRFARSHGLPVVHTMHNRVDVGIEATAPFPALVLRGLNIWGRRMLRPEAPGGGTRARRMLRPDRPTSVRPGADGWAYLRLLAAGADAVTAPSSHFARRLEAHDVFAPVDVVWNGIDDDILDAALDADGDTAGHPAAGTAVGATPGAQHPPRFVWVGRMSPEKRLLPFLEAVARSGIVADVEIIGGGGQLGAAKRIARASPGGARVVFSGRLPYVETLRRISAADAVVQTSIGFETQGMTVFEAASLGTASIVSDPDIAGELGSGFWAVRDGSVASLADTLRGAARAIESGAARTANPAVGEAFRQSSRTAAMVAVYERAIELHRGRTAAAGSAARRGVGTPGAAPGGIGRHATVAVGGDVDRGADDGEQAEGGENEENDHGS